MKTDRHQAAQDSLTDEDNVHKDGGQTVEGLKVFQTRPIRVSEETIEALGLPTPVKDGF